MIRVVNRWRVKPDSEGAFIEAWKNTCNEQRRAGLEVSSCLLLRSADRGAGFVAIARWSSITAWRRFVEELAESPPAWAADTFDVMKRVAELVSTELFEEIATLDEAPPSVDEKLDEALEESFPASDPPAPGRR